MYCWAPIGPTQVATGRALRIHGGLLASPPRSAPIGLALYRCPSSTPLPSPSWLIVRSIAACKLPATAGELARIDAQFDKLLDFPRLDAMGRGALRSRQEGIEDSMTKTLGIVHVGPASPGSSPRFARKLAGKPLLEHVVRRMTDCQRLDAVVVVSGDPRQDQLVASLVPPDVATVTRRISDGLSRFVAAIDQFNAQAVVRVAADQPFVDPVLVDRLVNTADAHPACDYIGYCCKDGRLAVRSQIGLVAEWCSAEALRCADRSVTRQADRDGVTPCLFGHPELFMMRLVPLPRELDRDDVRLCVNREEDWEHAQVIYDALGHEEWDWQRLADLLDHQPRLRQRMAALNRAGSPA